MFCLKQHSCALKSIGVVSVLGNQINVTIMALTVINITMVLFFSYCGMSFFMPVFRMYALGMIYGMWPTCSVCTTIYTSFLYYFTVVCYSPFDFVSIWFAGHSTQCATTCISKMWATCHNDIKLCVCVCKVCMTQSPVLWHHSQTLV